MNDKSCLFPTGKIPQNVLRELLEEIEIRDPQVLLGPGIGLDCALLDFGSEVLALKSDPITFATDMIGWYAVHVNANDIVTTGAEPRWFAATILLPERMAQQSYIEKIFTQIREACAAVGAELIGGHTEISDGIRRPILSGTMIGTCPADKVITPAGAKAGDRLLLTKGIPIEATAIIARDRPAALVELPEETIEEARNYLIKPGISVVPEARAALNSCGVTAMHDPTEGGLASALWELASACGAGIEVILERIHIPDVARLVCEAARIDPIEAISSGALLIVVDPHAADEVKTAVSRLGIHCEEIGVFTAEPGVWMKDGEKRESLTLPDRDAITSLFDDRKNTTDD